ncbi:MAG: SGNH/GDSL hydrolase family protein [Lentisphaeria bacterium]|nr:SGNH/GDSL hydrolase family protein [Lentisphaeria bacterium]
MIKHLRICTLLGLFLSPLLAHADDGVPNFCHWMKKGEYRRIVFFGGDTIEARGIKGGANVRGQCRREIQKSIPKAKMRLINSGLHGTGSWLGAFRAQKEVVRHYVPMGMVVIDFASDDVGQPKKRVIAAMDGIVRRIRRAHPTCDIVFLHTLNRHTLPGAAKGELPETITWHNEVAAHYGIPVVDAAAYVAAKMKAGEVALQDLTDAKGRPNQKAHKLFAQAFGAFFAASAEALPTDWQLKKRTLPKALSPSPIAQGELVPYEQATLGAGWLAWQESTIPRFFHVAQCTKPGPVITLRFRGDTAGLYHLTGPDTGNLQISVDNGDWRPLAAFDEEARSEYRAQALLLAEGLAPDKEHTIRVRLALGIPKGSKGTVERLAMFLVNGKAVYKNPYQGKTPLERLDMIYATMPPVTYKAVQERWKLIPKTMAKLQAGAALTIVMLGDSIINDTAHSQYQHLLMRRYPKCNVKIVRSVRGSTGCWWYKDENRIKAYVLDHSPDLVMIGGISQRKDLDSIREVIHQMRAAQPGMEVMLTTGAFGRVDPRTDKNWTYEVPQTGDGYRTRLQQLAREEKCEFFDLRGAWGRYIRQANQAHGSFKRDPIHANDRGKQILGRILDLYFAPK